MSNLTDYLHHIETVLAAGNATEHTHRPALKALLESLETGIVATNEPRRIQCGAPDFILTRGQTPLGYLEAKDVGKPLDAIEADDQLKRYRESLGNLILTDYLEFRWYVGGQPRLTARLASLVGKNRIRREADGAERVGELLHAFLHADTPTVANPKELAERMAHLARQGASGSTRRSSSRALRRTCGSFRSAGIRSARSGSKTGKAARSLMTISHTISASARLSPKRCA